MYRILKSFLVHLSFFIALDNNLGYPGILPENFQTAAIIVRREVNAK